MLPVSKRMSSANDLLMPYAVPHGGGLGRMHPEPEDDSRFPFQRDRDRILHTQSFRRLMHKTQVFVAGTGDHYRTRITHTLEVAQVSRDIARTLGLNEDLAESIALAHDLGHTPFGHAGEEALHACVEPFGKRFEHNLQSLRIVTVLEQRSKHYSGLNLNREVLEGLMKHRTPHDMPEDLVLERSPSLEAQVVNLADEIAYTAHDTDDGLRAGIITTDELRALKLGNLASQRAKETGTEIRGAIVHALIHDLYAATEQAIAEHNLQSLADVYAAKDEIVRFTPDMRVMLKELRALLWSRLYMNAGVLAQATHGQQVIRDLFADYRKNPPEKVLSLHQKNGGALEEAVKDYVAGMTDLFALEQWQQRTGPRH
ncbi:MAG TPA: dNTP triphosphohydrolase [Candidatus Peribacteria bacterium]|nr:dNTP triphosphohydrolase [Candidatus Peribacteria bacterium]